jgi:tetratricopeptide (TPR) repeat protein
MVKPSVATDEIHRLDEESRLHTINRWPLGELLAPLRQVPASELADHAWLLLALGRLNLRYHSDFLQASQWIDAAEMAFERHKEHEGLLWVAVEWAVLGFYMHDPQPGLEAARRALATEPANLYLTATLHSSAALCLASLGQYGEAEDWLTLAASELARLPDPQLQQVGQIELAHRQALVALARGDISAAAILAQRAVELVKARQAHELAPWCYYLLGLASWRRGELSQAAATLALARQLAENSGHTQLWCWIVATQGHVLRDEGELNAAREAYRLAESWGEESYGPAFLFVRESQLAEARWSTINLLQLAQHQQDPLAKADALVLLTLIALRAGRVDGAAEHIEQAATIYQAHGQAYRLASARLYQAALLYNLEEQSAAAAALAEGLAILARQEAYNCEWWLPDIIENLLFRAIQGRIEASYARKLLNRRFLNFLPPLDALSANALRVHGGAEMELARQAMRNLLPASPPLVPGLDLAAISLAAEAVGGDLYGYYPLEQQPEQTRSRIGLAIGDIAGKGLAAALLSSGTAVALATASVDNPLPAELLDRVQTALQVFTARGNAHVALCYVTLDRLEQGWLVQSANAGAIPPYIRRANGAIEWLPAYGLPLGSSREAPSTPITSWLGSGDTLLLLSDGIVEAMNTEREMFGFERLEECLAVAPVEQGARALVAYLLTAVQTHAAGSYQHDDTTIVVVIVH